MITNPSSSSSLHSSSETGESEPSSSTLTRKHIMHHHREVEESTSTNLDLLDIEVVDDETGKVLEKEEESVAELIHDDNEPQANGENEEKIDGDLIVGAVDDEEEESSAPKAIKENFDKLNELLQKTETYSRFIHEHVVGVLPNEEEASEDEEEADGEPTIDSDENGKRKRRGRKSTTTDESAQKKLKSVFSKSKSLQTANQTILKYEQPKYLTGTTLRDYQLMGVNWLISLYENGVNGILADEMGLGKTIQTIGLFCHLYEKGVKGPFLVVAPLSTVSNWVNEIDKWAPDLGCVLYHGNKDDRAMIRSKSFKKVKKGQISVVVSSYEIVMRDKKFLANKFNWKYIVVDEAHRLKNFNCRLTRELKQYNSENRLLLTGTPLQNNLSELWSLLNFLLPSIFDDLSAFNKWFDFTKNQGNTKNEYIANEKTQLISKLHNILRPFLLRRLKSDVDIGIPKKREFLVYARMTSMQREYYEAVKKKDLAPIFQDEQTRKASTSNLLNILMQLRKICNHPFLIREFESRSNESERASNTRFLKESVQNCGKFSLLVRMLENLKKNGHKVLVFSLMTRFLDVLEDYIECRGDMKYCRIDGSIAQTEREQKIKEFNENDDVFMFLLSTRAGGLGINLTAADTVIIYDSDWNPQIDLQAQDRCHRIGQTRNVRIFRLLTLDTVEKKVLQTATKKLKLERLIIHKGNFKGNQHHQQNKITITAQNLLEILSDGDQNKETKSGSSRDDEEIDDETLDRLINERDDTSTLPASGVGYEEAHLFEEQYH
ncbi:hypothetical protein C9374_000141 [Naegleria lovaniensis]|uniref:Uncharacterized protein n=1 Tax=Naegleria lovaniensis TaxID=51637 RepID=A0AA88GTP9_NAELO|nr:uncharacterized protein C9374_000141 [Naegleria lovaniensis]KAG2388702.1 hypothetical protein C9374_000141 [Naegleria lovaniensis]